MDSERKPSVYHGFIDEGGTSIVLTPPEGSFSQEDVEDITRNAVQLKGPGARGEVADVPNMKTMAVINFVPKE